MRKLRVTLGILLFLSLVARGQTSYLENTELMALSDSCLRHTYNFEFNKARAYQQELEKRSPEHPAPPFLKGLILYWEQFPLTPEKPETEQFIHWMSISVDRSQKLVNQEKSHMEGVFFDLFGRAFMAMFWADNGKPVKAASDLRIIYRRTMEGFRLKDTFVEFYFSTGMYNYYTEAYPEAYPVYKPLVSFIPKGDKKTGLLQLNHAINHCVYLRVEALQFMALIQLNFENDLNTATLYAERLLRENPANVYYQGLMISIQLHQYRFDRVERIIENMKGQDDPYSVMIRTLSAAYMNEWNSRSDIVSLRDYKQLIKQADALGPIANHFKAMAFMGLSRLHEKQELHGEAKRYARKAARYTSFPFILNEKGPL